MYPLHLTLLFIAQIYCEWVEISQQHYNYKKPLRQTHNYPLLASTTPKGNDLERTTNRNRIYINDSVTDYNWNTEPNQLFKGDLDNSAVNSETRDNFANKRPLNDIHKDVLIVRRRKPENTNNKDKKNTLNEVRNRESDDGTKKKTSGNEVDKRKPLEDYKGPIEVLNLSVLEYTTAGDNSNIQLNDNELGKNKLKRKDNVITTNNYIKTTNGNKRQPESRRETSNRVEINTPRPEKEYKTKPPLFKTTNMRRVNIVRSTSTYRTPTQQFNEEEYQSNKRVIHHNSTKTVEVKNESRPPTTPYRFPHIGHVKKVNITKTVRTTPKPKVKDNKPTKDSEDEDEFTEKSALDRNNNAIQRVDKPSPERIKTTPSKIKTHKTSYNNKSTQKNINPEDVMVQEILNEDEGKDAFTVHEVASLGNIDIVQNFTGKSEPTDTPNLKLDTDIDDLVENDESDDHFNTVHRESNFPRSTEAVPTTIKYKTKNIATERPEEAAQIERYQPNPYTPIRPSHEPIPEFVTKDDHFINGDSTDNFDSPTENVFKLKPTEPTYKEIARPGNHLDVEQTNKRTKPQDPANEHQEQKKEEQISDKTKPSAIENLIKFLKTVTEIISRNSRRGVQGKMRYLEDLRDTILANIEERLEAAFPDDSPAAATAGAAGWSGRALRGRGQHGRSGRSADAPRGHVEFPSSESALMTISFLTFAVFLIKLILQVIQAYKNKTMMLMPTVISAAVGRARAARAAHAAQAARALHKAKHHGN